VKLPRVYAGLVSGFLVFSGASVVAFPAIFNEACNSQAGQQVLQTLPPLGACIIQAAGSDFVDALNDPASLVGVIVSECSQYGLVTAAMIVSEIESWFEAAPAALDSGVAEGGAGAVGNAQRTRLNKVLVAALSTENIVMVSADGAR
jgi:hypothetical protein